MNNPLDLDNLREIGLTLARNKTRTFLTAFGIFWGTAMLAMLWGGADGLRGILLRHVQGFSTNSAFVFGGRTTISYRGFNKGTTWSLTDRDVEIIRSITPDIEYSSCFNNRGATIKYETKSKSGSLHGVEGDYVKIIKPLMYEGRFINERDVYDNAKVVVIGKNVKDALFPDSTAIGRYVDVNGVYMRVIGVAGNLADVNIGGRLEDGAVVPIGLTRLGYSDPHRVDVFVYTSAAGKTPAQLRPYIERAVRINHPIHPDDKNAMWFMDVSEQFKQINMLFYGLTLLAIFVGAGTLMAGVIGVGNIMWIVVKERTHEIGIRRAIGAKPRDIIAQILSESMVLTAVAGLSGIVLAVLVLGVADHLTYDPAYGSAHFDISPWRALVIMTVFLVFGGIAGLVPSLKAMRIKPVEAINDK